MFNFVLAFICDDALISTTDNAAGSLDMSAIEPKFFSNLSTDDQLVNILLEESLKVPSFFILSIVAIF
jgi:hypothetical protein